MLPHSLGAVTTMVIGGAGPGGRSVLRVQVTTPALCAQTQVLPLALTKLTPAGSVSVTVIVAAAVEGPPLVTCSVYVSAPPAVTGSGASLLVIDRSAEAVTVVGAVSQLFSGLGSAVGELTQALLLMLPPSLGAVTTMVIGGAGPGGRSVLRVQVTTPALCAQTQVLPLALTKVTPAGSVSVTVIVAAAVEGPPLVTCSVYVSAPPAVTGSGASLLVIDRSAEAVTVVGAVSQLFSGLGSAVGELTQALLLMLPPSLGAVTTMVIGGAGPGGRSVLRVQVTTPALCAQTQVLPLALTKVTPAGSVSVTVIVAAAVEGPPLVTCSVYVSAPPAVTGSGASLLVIDRSAEAVTVVGAVSQLFSGLGSAVGELTQALLLMLPPSLGAVTTMVIGGAGPGGRSVLRVQVTTPALCAQTQVLPLALTKVTPAGSVSVTVIVAAAVEGPPLVTCSVYVSAPPAVTGSGASLLVIDRSAEAVTVVGAVSQLFSGLGSAVGELTQALLLMLPPSLGAVTTMVIGGAGPGGRSVLRVQVTTPALCAQTQVLPLALTKVTPAGSVSVTVIVAAAVEGPPLVTCSVYVSAPPAVTGSGASLLVIDRSAEAVTVVGAVAQLFSGLGSAVGELTQALLLMLPPSLGAVTTMVIGGAGPGGRSVLRVQVPTPPLCAQTQVLPLALTKVTPAGSVSVTVIVAAAVEGPPLVTCSVYVSAPPAVKIGR